MHRNEQTCTISTTPRSWPPLPPPAWDAWPPLCPVLPSLRVFHLFEDAPPLPRHQTSPPPSRCLLSAGAPGASLLPARALARTPHPLLREAAVPRPPGAWVRWGRGGGRSLGRPSGKGAGLRFPRREAGDRRPGLGGRRVRRWSGRGGRGWGGVLHPRGRGARWRWAVCGCDDAGCFVWGPGLVAGLSADGERGLDPCWWGCRGTGRKRIRRC
mmetsp:Transcript_8954/g.19779  ORF Transcript_8954/g.19779 Transcript_8954/m.19779 type:complete len:213 (+) Transcript_8954:120-758(+)